MIFYFFRSILGRRRIRRIIRHVAVAGITGSDLMKLIIPLPPIGQQKSISKVLIGLDNIIYDFMKYLDVIYGVKKLVLNILLSGQIRLKGAEND